MGVGMAPMRVLGEVEGSFVFGADGGVEQVGVAQAHLELRRVRAVP